MLPSSAESWRSGGIDHEEVVRRFRNVQSGASEALANSEKKVISSELEKLCVKHLRSIVYDAEDAEQDLKLLRQQEELETNSQAMKRLHQKMSSICEDYQDLGKKFKSLSPQGQGTRREESERTSSGCFSTQNNIYSLNEYKDGVVKILTDKGQCNLKEVLHKDCKASNSSKLIILPITGVAGSGKTTLVQHIFQDVEIRKSFTPLWVCAFSIYDALGLMNSVLEIAGGSPCRQLGMAQIKLIEWLNREKKRILLVLDDACNTNRHHWENFWAPFMQSQVEGCVVLITTRDYEVIDALPNHVPQTEHLTILPLEFEDCWALFESIVGSARVEDGELKKIAEEIVRNCGGIPFSVKQAATNLNRKDQLWQWEEFSKVGLRCSYWLDSYRKLEQQLKSCFLYCSLFPSGYLFSKDYLVKLWISQGFTEKCGKTTTLKDVADKYFERLLSGYLICQTWKEFCKYEMPNPVRELADSILRPYFRRLNDPDSSDNVEKSSQEKVRHISYVVQDGEVEINMPSLSDFRNLRSFLIVQKQNRTINLRSMADNTFENMRYLRTLDLSYTDIEELPSSIKCLSSLCFLGLNGTQIGHLPDSLCTLYNLQALELNLCKKLSGLPKDIGNLVRLQYLLLDPKFTSFCIPEGLSRLTDLKTLPFFNVSKNQNECTGTDELKYSGIQELEKLDSLVELHIRGLCNVSVEDSKLANLDRKKHLKDLTLSWYSRQNESNNHGGYNSETQVMDINSHMQQVLNNLKPHANLPNLVIEYYAGREFPKWIGDSSFKNLKFIKLKDCKNCYVLPSLGLLPSLESLAISCGAVKWIDSTFCGRVPEPPTGMSSKCGGFSSLERFVLEDMNEWEKWSGVTEEDFACLRELELFNCPLLTELPKIKHLKSLKMKNCNSVTSMPSFPSLEELEISYSKELTAIPSLDSLMSMQMLNCNKVRHFPASSRLEKLEIKDCKELEDFDSLINLEKLTVENCGKVRQLPDFPSLLELEICNCTGLETFSSMTSLKKLHIRGNNKLAVNSIPDSIQTLIIGFHVTLMSFDELRQKKLKTLELFSCLNLSSIPQMDSLESLTIENCDGLCEIPLLRSLTSLTLMYCGKLETIHKQPKLRDLWVEDCDQLRYVEVNDIIVASLESPLIANCPSLKSYVKGKFVLSFEP